MIKNVFFDFNGTILDDIDLCLELLNKILIKQNKPLVDINKYKGIFQFPIINYYKAAGIDFTKDSFNDLSIDFIKEYQPRSFNCSLVKNVKEVILKLNEMNINCYILSASEKGNLIEQCEKLNIKDLFKEIVGIDNIHASSKVDVGKKFILDNNLDQASTIMIGDTTHDYEVAKAMGIRCVLFTGGHQSRKVLDSVDALKIDDMKELLEIVR